MACLTLGSFIGTFLPVLLTIPSIGTRNTFLAFSLVLLVVALVGLARSGGRKLLLQHLWMPLDPDRTGVRQCRGSPSRPAPIRCSRPSRRTTTYRSSRPATSRYLRLNDGEGVHSVYSPDTLDYGGPWEQFLVGPYFYANAEPSQVTRMAIVGLAAGTAARQATAVYGPIPIDGFELDPKIVEVGRKYFGENLDNLTIHIGDGRWNLEQSPFRYDIIAVDAYRPPYIPPHMTTQEFYEICAAHLTDHGVLTINVGSVPGDRRLINGLATTMATVFPSVHVMDIPGTLNTMIYATMQPTSSANFAANLSRFASRNDIHPLLRSTMEVTFASLLPGYRDARRYSRMILRPIERIVDDMVVQFALGGELEGLKP